MTARSPTALMLSAALHALFAGVFFFIAYVLKDEVIKQDRVIELVQGEGDNYGATEAPALGTPGGVRFEMPNMPAAPQPVMPAASEPPPVQPTPAQPEPTPAVEPKPTPKNPPKPETSPVTKVDNTPASKVEPTTPNFTKGMQRVEHRIEIKQKAQREKEAKAAALAAALAAKQADLAAKKAAQAKGAGGPIKVSKIDAEGIAQGVVGGSPNNKTGGAGGTALSREEQDLLETYFALLSQRLREAHEKPVGLSDLLAARVEFYIAADGSISKVSIVKSSGNAEFDQSALDAFRKLHPIGPRPDGKGSMRGVWFKMKDEE